MKMKRFAPFVLALLITLATASYQKRTGPTWPKQFSAVVDNIELTGSLIRSGTTGENAIVEIAANKAPSEGSIILEYRKFKFEQAWSSSPMQYSEGELTAELPTLPPAGKYEYRISQQKSPENKVSLVDAVIIRFKGAVPLAWLVPHIISMFSAMLLSNFIAMRLIFRQQVSIAYPVAVAAILACGGMFFGAFVQKFAFGKYWTGFPFGTDLTDNKTLIALVGWLVAIAIYRKWAKSIVMWIAIIVMTIAFAVPHSIAGSELDFRTNELKK